MKHDGRLPPGLIHSREPIVVLLSRAMHTSTQVWGRRPDGSINWFVIWNYSRLDLFSSYEQAQLPSPLHFFVSTIWFVVVFYLWSIRQQSFPTVRPFKRHTIKTTKPLLDHESSCRFFHSCSFYLGCKFCLSNPSHRSSGTTTTRTTTVFFESSTHHYIKYFASWCHERYRCNVHEW